MTRDDTIRRQNEACEADRRREKAGTRGVQLAQRSQWKGSVAHPPPTDPRHCWSRCDRGIIRAPRPVVCFVKSVYFLIVSGSVPWFDLLGAQEQKIIILGDTAEIVQVQFASGAAPFPPIIATFLIPPFADGRPPPPILVLLDQDQHLIFPKPTGSNPLPGDGISHKPWRARVGTLQLCLALSRV